MWSKLGCISIALLHPRYTRVTAPARIFLLSCFVNNGFTEFFHLFMFTYFYTTLATACRLDGTRWHRVREPLANVAHVCLICTRLSVTISRGSLSFRIFLDAGGSDKPANCGNCVSAPVISCKRSSNPRSVAASFERIRRRRMKISPPDNFFFLLEAFVLNSRSNGPESIIRYVVAASRQLIGGCRGESPANVCRLTIS